MTKIALKSLFYNFLTKAAVTIMRPVAMQLSCVLAYIISWLPGNSAHRIFYGRGVHVLRKHYYLPIPDESDMDKGFWDRQTALAGLEMNDQFGLSLLDKVFPVYMGEFRNTFPIERMPDSLQFWLINGSYMAVDAHVYYAFIRHFRPKIIIEIGCGSSTVLACAAAMKNLAETGQNTDITAIEPFPWDLFRSGSLPGFSRLIEKKVQDVDLSLFTKLQKGDILFIDSSHVLREGNDVQFEYLEILPRLAPGVLVHIHDVSLPRRYPKVYFENQLYWNEQYLLQAFLCFNTNFEVVWPGNYMMLKYPEKVLRVFPEFHIMRKHYPMSEPTAFWMRVKDKGQIEVSLKKEE